jgi:hypothetical protein
LRPETLWRALVFVVIVAALYGVLRTQRTELVDFRVPRLAAERFIAHEPLYLAEDGHYQYKYFPAFALVMVPFTWLPKTLAEVLWFALTVAMSWALLRLSVFALPDRRRSATALMWLALLVTTKFLVKEIGFGNFNLPLALLIVGGIIAAQRGSGLTAAALIAVAVFVKPYALVLVPWIAWRLGWRAVLVFGVVLAGGLVLPALFYGWQGNLTLLQAWYGVVTATTAPNLLGGENISFASMWAKWIGPQPAAAALALASTIVAMAAGLVLMWRSRRVHEPYYLEVGYFLILVPLISPQGWDYVLLIATPAYVLLLDRWRDLSPGWRAVALVGVVLTSFTVFDIFRRTLYIFLVQRAAPTVGAVLLAMCLIRLRSRALA